MTIIGLVACPHCSEANGFQELLGTVKGEPVMHPLVLRNVVGREGTLWILECGHKIVKTHWNSAQEHLDGFTNKGCFPAIPA